MQNFLPLIKDFKRAILLLLLVPFLSSLSINSFAQSPAQISVNVNILPPYSPYYSDYSGANAGKVLLIVRNLTSTQKRIKLTGELKGDNGIRISTKSTYVPLQPIILQPNETKQLNGAALKDIFDLNSLNVYGIDKVKLVQTSRIPEGNYTFCLQAVDMNTNQVITDQAPLGCTSFNISYPNAPILISPMAFEKIEAKYNRTSFQNITFSWMNAGTVPMNTQYIIQIAEMPEIPIYDERGRITGYTQNSKDPNQILNSTSVFILNQRIIGTSYVYGTGNVPLRIGKKYAWRAIATDPSNKTGFMNDGKSAANVFIFGSLEQLAVLQPDLLASSTLLNIISPACKTGSDVMIVGPNTTLNLNWLWKDQIESMTLFGSLDSNLLKHYTKVNMTPAAVNADTKSKAGAAKSDLKMPEVFETIKFYALNFSSKGDKYGSAKNISVKVLAPKQSVNFTKKQVDSLGLIVGQTYKLTVAAISDKSTIIKSVESCNWVLKAEIPQAIPKLVIKGKLNYTFDKKEYFGSNSTSISLQIVDGKTTKIAKFSGSGPFTKKLNIAYATTDANGNFTAEIDQLPSDTGSNKFIAIEVNSPYFQKPTINASINIPKISTNSTGGTVVYAQEPLLLGDLNLNAFNYKVTVTLNKQFNSSYDGVKPAGYSGGVIPSINVETNYVNANSKIEAGILVGIYRKAKRSDIPTYEGDVNLKSPIFPLQNGFIRVGEAKTFISEGKAQVVFDKLLLSWANDDEYYIKAILPKIDPNNKLQGDTEADLEAPEQRLAFMPTHFSETTTNYSKLLNYQLISKRPPTAKIRGKIMQQWPSAPGVLYPYANKPITVQFSATNSIPSDYSELLKGPDGCQYYLSVLKQVDENGKVIDLPAGGTNNSTKIVATGVTDKDGNYEIDISAVMEMKNYKLVVQKYNNTLMGPTCTQKADAKTAAAIEALKEAAKTTGSGAVNGYTYDSFKKQVEDLAKATGKNVDKDLSAGGNGGYDSSGDEIDFGKTTADDLKKKLGFGGKGPTGGGTNYEMQNIDFKAAEGVTKAAKGTKAATSITKKYFVANENTFGLPLDSLLLPESDQSIITPYADEVYGSLSRSFYIEGLKPISTINNDKDQTVEKFVVQPFGSVNLGVSVIIINELSKTISVNVVLPQKVINPNTHLYENVKTNDNRPLGGAKLFIFRLSNNKPKNCPPGEGGLTHAVKSLPKSTYNGNDTKYIYANNASGTGQTTYASSSAYDKPVEWVLDEPIDIELVGANAGKFTLNEKRLMPSYDGGYSGLIIPNPDGGGGRFDPLIIDITWGDGIANVMLAPSRIAGRVMDKTSSKPIANAPVKIVVYEAGTATAKLPTYPIYSDQNGYFEVTNGANGLTWASNAHAKVTASPIGYNNPPDTALNIQQVNALKDIIQKDGGNYDFRIDKEPSSALFITVFGEQINDGAIEIPIKAYVKRSDGTIFTDSERISKGGIKVTGGVNQVVKIIPEDPAYFEDEFSIIPNVTNNKTVHLKRLKHRMKFLVTETNGQLVPANSIKITINNGLNKINTVSGTSFEFENVSVNNYTVQIAANGTNYIPKIVGITNVESKVEQVYSLQIEKGATISGIVTLDGSPVENAKVYLDYSASEAIPMVYTSTDINNNVNASTKTDKAALETVTDKFGYYELKGLPAANNETVKVHATLNTNVMVNGALANVKIVDKIGAADLKLTKFNGPLIDKVYGFPLSVERVERLGNANKVLITGIVDLGKNNSSFTWLNPDTKVRISNVTFDFDANGQPTLPVKLEALLNLKMKYLNKYNVKVENLDAQGKAVPLTIEKSDKGGAINAQVSITDNSFNFPSSYLSFTDKTGFYLSTYNSAKAKNITNIKAIYTTAKEDPIYYLSDKVGEPLKFRFVGFENTIADSKKSYIGTDGKIHLAISFKGKVKDANPGDVDVNIKDLVLDGNTIYPTKGSEALKLKLQTWDLEVNDWELDVKKGGIVSKSAVIKTGFVDVPVTTFNLRSDMFVLKNFALDKISLGNGLLNLVNVDTTNFNLVYDQACGSDLSAHWRFSGTTANKNYVAQIPLEKVDKKFPSTILDVKYFQMISFNNENIISLSSAQTGIPLYDNPKFKFFPASVRSDVGSFSLGGQAQISLPRVNNVGLNLIFNKPNNGVKFDMLLNSFDLNFEGKGYVKYQNDASQTIINNNDKITRIRGTVVEPGKFNPIMSTLSFGEGDDGTILLDQGFELNLEGGGAIDKSENVYLVLKSDAKSDLNNKLITNGMKVAGTDWSTLRFTGDLIDPKSKSLSPKNPIYNFEVLGDIQANSSAVTMDKATPLGDVKMVYDFKTGRMLGSLHMADVAFGSYKFTGDVEIGYGKGGFLLLGAGQLNTGTLFLIGGDGFGTFNIGLLFANSTLLPNSIAKVTQYSRAPENACWLTENKDNFQGFFLTGGYDIINEHKGFDIGIASIYLNAVLGVEASIGANFNAKNYRALLGAHGRVSAGMSAITGTSISGYVDAHLTASAEYDPKGFSVTGAAGIAVDYNVSQYLVAKTVSFSGTQEAKVLFQYKPGVSTTLNFSLGKDNGKSECPSK